MILESDMNTNNKSSASPAKLAWRRLQKNRAALGGGCILVGLYLLALLAGFFSPYSPTEDEFRTHFFHPPTQIYFHDSNGSFTLRPHVNSTTLVDRRSPIYAESNPLYLGIKIPEANQNPYAADNIEETSPVARVYDSNGKIIAEASYLTEIGKDTGIFLAAISLPIDSIKFGSTLVAKTNSGKEIKIPVVAKLESQVAEKSSDFFVADSFGNPTSAYVLNTQKYPIRFFVRGWKYKLFWLFHTDIHLFGVDEPAHIFLLGSDQTGRDIFSRILHGARISMTVGLVGVLLTTILGLLVGSIAGYYGGAIDNILMRFAELLLSIPALYLILTLRNIIPDRMEQSYEKIREFGLQTFAWQQSLTAFIIVSLIVILLLSYYIYRNKWRKSSIMVSVLIMAVILFGRHLVEISLAIMQKILPGSTHLTSDWTYFLIILILSTVGWASMSRVIRGMVLSLREEEYVLAARATGAGDARVLLGHILPNTFGYVIVRATLLVPAYILGEVTLSFLGVGVQEPVPSWGNMLSAAQSLRVLQEFTWILAPGFFLFVAVLAFNFLGDGLRDALDPRS
ncbi:ABC transporter permease [bacterium]|nr:ABC transporter permease [bacterium]